MFSRLTWLSWLTASVPLTYCFLRGEFLMGLMQCVNVAAIAATIILVRRSNRLCHWHAIYNNKGFGDRRISKCNGANRPM